MTGIYARGEGRIAFQLYQTDVVTWLSDNSVVIDNYGTKTTSGFARRFLPAGFHLNHPSGRRGVAGGNQCIGYHDGSGWRLCDGANVRFVETAAGWEPDESTLRPMRFPELDRTRTREVAARHHLHEFGLWLQMAPHHLDIDHIEWDLGHCAMALKARDFRTATEYLPTISSDVGFGMSKTIEAAALPIGTRDWQTHVTMGSLDKLKLALWEDEGSMEDITMLTVSTREFDRRMARVRELKALGIYRNWGPR